MRITERRRLVIELVEDVRRIERIRDFKRSSHGSGVTSSRIVRALEEPDTADISIATVRAAHEIWAMSLIIDALDAEIKNKILKVRGSPEEPAAILRTKSYGALTIWYQFPRYGPNRHGELLHLCAEGGYEEVRNILGLETAPRSFADSLSIINRGNLRPDIVIAKGSFRFANDIRTETEDEVKEKAIVIDPKIEMKESDVEQLEAYTRLFPRGSEFICPCMNGVTRSPNGWGVIEDVRPWGKGVEVFRGRLRVAVREICSSKISRRIRFSISRFNVLRWLQLK